MTPKQCFNEGCDKPGTFKCTGCLVARYCSRDCQKAHRPTHKVQCVISANCFIIRAAPKSATQRPLDNVAGQLEPHDLASIGNEVGEKAELSRVLGWTSGATEVGKFYDHKDTDQWYYYVYGAKTHTLTKNQNCPGTTWEVS
jgi:MYND finger